MQCKLQIACLVYMCFVKPHEVFQQLKQENHFPIHLIEFICKKSKAVVADTIPVKAPIKGPAKGPRKTAEESTAKSKNVLTTEEVFFMLLGGNTEKTLNVPG